MVESNNNNIAPVNWLTIFISNAAASDLPLLVTSFPRSTILPQCLPYQRQPRDYIKTHGPEPIDLVNSIIIVVVVTVCRHHGRASVVYTRKTIFVCFFPHIFFYYFHPVQFLLHTTPYFYGFSSFLVSNLVLYVCKYSMGSYPTCPRADNDATEACARQQQQQPLPTDTPRPPPFRPKSRFPVINRNRSMRMPMMFSPFASSCTDNGGGDGVYVVITIGMQTTKYIYKISVRTLFVHVFP